MKSCYIIPLLALAGVGVAAAPQTCLVQSGKPKAVIVVAADATVSEAYAGSELAKTIKQISGAALPVVKSAKAGQTRIIIGQTAMAKKLMGRFDWQTLRRDGILIKTVGKDIVISGDRPRGTIYAVEELLEKYLGVRYWAPDSTKIPRKSTITLPAVNLVYTPKLMYREPFFTQATHDAAFAMHIRANGHHNEIPEKMGGHYTLLGWCHTSYELLPPKDYYAAHPEWYALINGKRDAGNTQLCMTNPEMKKEFVKNALKWIDKDPQAGMISITQNDCFGPCQCDKCREVVKKTGAESGLLLSFVNDVATEIEKKYPDFLIETLAYQYTRPAPINIRPKDNVIIRLCSIENDFGRPITAPSNASFYRDLQDWKKIAKRLYIWNYTVNFSSFTIPHPNISALGPDIRTWADNHVIGIFEQGDNYNATAAMAPLKTYLMSKLMWNPYQPQRPIVEDFMNGYYGAAGKPMLKALDVMEAAVQRDKGRLTCYMSVPGYYTIDDLKTIKNCYDQAEAAVKGNAALLKRVQIQRLAVDHLLIITKKSFLRKGQEVPGIDWPKLVNHFIDFSNQTGNDWIREGGKWNTNEYRQALMSSIQPLPVYYFSKPTTAMGVSGKVGVDWLDIQEPDFNLFNEGQWVNVVTDDTASNSGAAEMPCTHTQWAVQHEFAAGEVKWPHSDITLEFKVIPSQTPVTQPDSGVLTFGVYNPNNGTDANVTVKMSEVKPGYQSVTLKNVTLSNKVYAYVAPIPNAASKAIRVDRFTVQPSK